MALRQGNSGTARPDLASVANVLLNDQSQADLFAAMNAFGVYSLGIKTSGTTSVASSSVLRSPEGSDMQFTRTHGQPMPPSAPPSSRTDIAMVCLDRGQGIDLEEDSDEEAGYGGEAAFLQAQAMEGTRKMAEGMARLAHASLGGGTSPFTGVNSGSDVTASALWSASVTDIVGDFKTAKAALGFRPGAVYLDRDTWDIFLTASELWDSFNNAGFGQLNEEQGRAAMATVAGCRPENVFITDPNLGLGAYVVLYARPVGPLPDPRLQACGAMFAVSEYRSMAPPGVQESMGGDAMIASFPGIRASILGTGHTTKQLYVRCKADWAVQVTGGVRIKSVR